MKKLLLLLVFALLAVHPSLTDLPSEAEAQNDVDPIKYLEQFGYIARQTKTSESLTSPEPSIGALRPSGELVSAVRRFQTMANLPVTGELDEPTRAMMKRPRCGGSDVEGSASFVPSPISGRGISQVEEKSFVGSEKWEKTQLTYRVDRPPKSLKLLEEVDSELARAFDLWSAVCPLSFVRQQAVQQQKGRSTAEQPDISISFVRGAHEDEAPFDGPGIAIVIVVIVIVVIVIFIFIVIVIVIVIVIIIIIIVVIIIISSSITIIIIIIITIIIIIIIIIITIISIASSSSASSSLIFTVIVVVSFIIAIFITSSSLSSSCFSSLLSS